jgi:60 kDa SS-A/Ro ribonucleoprotein
MVSNGFTVADPDDPFMMDIVGFDTEAPKAMMNFVNGMI